MLQELLLILFPAIPQNTIGVGTIYSAAKILGDMSEIFTATTLFMNVWLVWSLKKRVTFFA